MLYLGVEIGQSGDTLTENRYAAIVILKSEFWRGSYKTSGFDKYCSLWLESLPLIISAIM
jgi:hypothetical protein